MVANPTVFVVDDDPGALESLRWMLEQADIPVKAYGSAREFLDGNQGEATGCLVLDVRMPEMDGLALQKALRDRKVRLPIIFITAYGDVPSCAEPSARGRSIFWKNRSTTKCYWTTSNDFSSGSASAATPRRTRVSAVA